MEPEQAFAVATAKRSDLKADIKALKGPNALSLHRLVGQARASGWSDTALKGLLENIVDLTPKKIDQLLAGFKD